MTADFDVITRIRQLCYEIERGTYGPVPERAIPLARDILAILGEEVPTVVYYDKQSA
jgi:hypothetical protein